MSFRLPPYPYDRLAALAKLADAHGRHGRLLHRDAVRPAAARRGRGVGVVGHRARLPGLGGEPRAARGRGRVAGAPLRPARCPGLVGGRLRGHQGARRLGAARPAAARAGARHRAVPGRVVSDLRHGRGAGRVPGRAGAAAAGRAGGLDLDAIDAADAARALVLWSNSPSNPTGGLGDLGAEAAWGRAHGVPVFSDECYAEFTWAGPPRSILEQRTRRRGRGPLPLQALEPGRRAGRLLRRRRRAGRVPARGAPARRPDGARARRRPPVRPPWGTTPTSRCSAERYRERLVLPGRSPRCVRLSRWRCPTGASTSGSRCPPARWPDALGDGRGAGRRRRAAGQPGRPLRGRRCRARPGRRRPADGAVGTGGEIASR